jgi:hypothetical protein
MGRDWMVCQGESIKTPGMLGFSVPVCDALGSDGRFSRKTENRSVGGSIPPLAPFPNKINDLGNGRFSRHGPLA